MLDHVWYWCMIMIFWICRDSIYGCTWCYFTWRGCCINNDHHHCSALTALVYIMQYGSCRLTILYCIAIVARQTCDVLSTFIIWENWGIERIIPAWCGVHKCYRLSCVCSHKLIMLYFFEYRYWDIIITKCTVSEEKTFSWSVSLAPPISLAMPTLRPIAVLRLLCHHVKDVLDRFRVVLPCKINSIATKNTVIVVEFARLKCNSILIHGTNEHSWSTEIINGISSNYYR